MTNTQYKGNQGTNTTNTGRGPSPFIWGDCPWDAIEDGSVDGITFKDDFDKLAYTTAITSTAANGPWKVFGSTGATWAPATMANYGTVTLGSDGDDEASVMQQFSLPFQISRSHGKLWFETRLKTSTIADTQFDWFAGFGDQMTISATVPITATAGSMADENWVGFHHLATDGDYVDAAYKADGVTAVYSVSDAQVLVADTYVKLGMKFDPDTFVLTWYGNGIALGTKTIPSAAGTDFPNDVALGLLFATCNAAAASPLLTIDWVRAAQLVP